MRAAVAACLLAGCTAGLVRSDKPLPDGPCVQQTIHPEHWLSRLTFIGDQRVADSDLARTLLTWPVSRRLMRQAQLLRGIGYALVGVGLLSTAGTAAALADIDNPDQSRSLAALTLLTVSVAGGAMTAVGEQRQRQAMARYNEQADVTGDCFPVW